MTLYILLYIHLPVRFIGKNCCHTEGCPRFDSQGDPKGHSVWSLHVLPLGLHWFPLGSLVSSVQKHLCSVDGVQQNLFYLYYLVFFLIFYIQLIVDAGFLWITIYILVDSKDVKHFCVLKACEQMDVV